MSMKLTRTRNSRKGNGALVTTVELTRDVYAMQGMKPSQIAMHVTMKLEESTAPAPLEISVQLTRTEFEALVAAGRALFDGALS